MESDSTIYNLDQTNTNKNDNNKYKLQLEVAGVTVPVPVEFCGVKYNGCTGATPACGDMKLGDKVKLCSSLTVPTESPDVSYCFVTRTLEGL